MGIVSVPLTIRGSYYRGSRAGLCAESLAVGPGLQLRLLVPGLQSNAKKTKGSYIFTFIFIYIEDFQQPVIVGRYPIHIYEGISTKY